MKTKADFLEDVHDEIVNLKYTITSTEQRRLVYKRFDPSYKDTCIYGLMTDCCYSPRAKYLLRRCASTVVQKRIEDIVGNSTYSSFRNVISKTTPSKIENRKPQALNYYSALEVYISLKKANVKEIFSYLNGRRNFIHLNPL